MQNKTYQEYTRELEDMGYVPLGRYEHTRKKDSTPVAFFWYSDTRPCIVVFAHTDNSGNPTTVSSVFNEQLL